MNNKTYYKCSKCGIEWIVQKSIILPHLSPDYQDNSTKKKPFLTICRKCKKLKN